MILKLSVFFKVISQNTRFMPLTNQLKNQHLLWRAGFGPAVEQLGDLNEYSSEEIYEALVKASSKKPDYINVADNYLQGLMMGIDQVGRVQLAAVLVGHGLRPAQLVVGVGRRGVAMVMFEQLDQRPVA